ncbi:ATP-binding protein [Micromonospora sp. NBC_01699]|uniref:ATP-binding protein n=1 Tax=Micromonospora sp. NBC_01699 TaxID=2975984 RepID=UPI002E2CA3BB|nr:ATP-binding protein [Micromonospora sp. NBC_01699]
MGGARDGDSALSSAAPGALMASFTATDISALRHRVARLAAGNGLHGDRLDDFVLAVYEILTNAVRHGGGTGSMRLEHLDGDLVCQVDDDGPGFSPGARADNAVPRTGGRGLRLARELTDSLTITHRAPGTSIQLRTSTRHPLPTGQGIRPATPS